MTIKPVTRKAYDLLNELTDISGIFGTEATLTPYEERALDLLMDLFPEWKPGD